MENGIRHLLKGDKKEMDKKEFKKAIKEVTGEYGFKYIKKGYYYTNEELIVVIDLQKSNFEDGYYINFGFFIKEMHQDVIFPTTNICDVNGRLTINYDGRIYECVHYSDIEPSILKEGLRKEIEAYLLPVMQEGLAKYFELYPQYICTATLNAKKYLGL